MQQGNVFTSMCQEFCPGGICVVGGMYGRGHAWQGACVAGAMHGRGVCMVGGHVWQGGAWQGCVHGRGHVWHAWQGGMHGGGHAGKGACMTSRCALQGACMAGGCAWQGGMCGRRNGHCSGQYASYWNAFLFYIFWLFQTFNNFWSWMCLARDQCEAGLRQLIPCLETAYILWTTANSLSVFDQNTA